jgi:RHS repeat-associated protein
MTPTGTCWGGGYSYDVENRLVSAGGEQYAYDGNNRRVWKRRRMGEEEYRLEVYFYGLGGERLGTYEMVRNGATLTFTTVADNLYFGGCLIRSGREVVAMDRLGSVRWRRNLDTGVTATFDYWPYGQEKPQATAQEREKFGTYYRDATGLDYADQRYYASTSGRFLTADPYEGSGRVEDPQSWNRYAYVEGDPVNRRDPSGLYMAWWEEPWGGGSWTGPYSVGVWGPEGYVGSYMVFPGGTPPVPTLNPGQHPAKTDPREVRARRYLRKAIDALKKALENPDCRALSSSDIDPIAIAEEMFGEDGKQGSFQFSPDLRADAETRPVDNSAKWNEVTREWLYSVVDVVFNSGTASGYWLQTSDRERGRMLVHELGHVFMYRFGQASTRFVTDHSIDNQSHNQRLEKICFPD